MVMETLSEATRKRLERAVRIAYLERMYVADGRLYGDIVGVVEAEVIRLTINRHRGNFSQTAKSLGINRNTLLKRRRALGIEAAQRPCTS